MKLFSFVTIDFVNKKWLYKMNSTKAASQATMWFFEKKTTIVYKSLRDGRKPMDNPSTLHRISIVFFFLPSVPYSSTFLTWIMEECNEKK